MPSKDYIIITTPEGKHVGLNKAKYEANPGKYAKYMQGAKVVMSRNGQATEVDASQVSSLQNKGYQLASATATKPKKAAQPKSAAPVAPTQGYSVENDPIAKNLQGSSVPQLKDYVTPKETPKVKGWGNYIQNKGIEEAKSVLEGKGLQWKDRL